jgi:polyisoprenyl-phosphate glycosyltransferase
MLTPSDSPDLCVVVAAFNEEKNLPELYAELRQVLGTRSLSWSMLVVDDGSTDGTAAELRKVVAADSRVRGLRLSRNFGHQDAISIGLAEAHGSAIAVMDCDLQDHPADLLLLYDRVKAGADVAYAVRRSRPEGISKRASYWLFYRLMDRLAEVDIPLDAGDFCVMDRRFAEKLNALPERLRFVRGLRAWLGGRQEAVPVDRGARRHGETRYPITKLVRLALDGLFSFSDAPLRLASLVGTIIAFLAFVGAVVVLGWKVTGQLPPGAGLATIALGVFFLGGLQLLTIGILGEYVSRVYREVKARPVAVVAEVIAAPLENVQHGHVRSIRP